MADVELAQHLAQELGEAVAVGDPREVLLVDGLEGVPIGAVVAGPAKGLERPAPDVLELGGPLGGLRP